ncbi:HXXXD-type acyl-transferase family protein [Striga asiatica]|uniref:HXXXD-type acyl-transferase family protein n=1 Tax=Striga asiatica TaxID=4170 RepID=A0A5A7PW04_STRAF|nr:HXXXD-type acyl-transferase family protein [Striga asiatica]
MDAHERRGHRRPLNCLVDCRRRLDPPLPDGYYGNAVVWPATVSVATDLLGNPLKHAVELVRRAKSEASGEYVRSTIGRRKFPVTRTYEVSEFTRMGFDRVDYGIEGSPPTSYYSVSRDSKGEIMGILVPMCLPEKAMEVFEEELRVMLKGDANLSCEELGDGKSEIFIKSEL